MKPNRICTACGTEFRPGRGNPKRCPTCRSGVRRVMVAEPVSVAANAGVVLATTAPAVKARCPSTYPYGRHIQCDRAAGHELPHRRQQAAIWDADSPPTRASVVGKLRSIRGGAAILRADEVLVLLQIFQDAEPSDG